MKTVNDLKTELIDHLAAVDKSKLDMRDLKTYCEVVKMVDELNGPTFYDTWSLVSKTFDAYSGKKYHPVELKEN